MSASADVIKGRCKSTSDTPLRGSGSLILAAITIDKMEPGYVTESRAKDVKPCGLANQKEVCYSNAVLQCLSRLMKPDDLRVRLGTVKLKKREPWYSGVDVTSARAIDERIK